MFWFAPASLVYTCCLDLIIDSLSFHFLMSTHGGDKSQGHCCHNIVCPGLRTYILVLLLPPTSSVLIENYFWLRGSVSFLVR